MAVRYLIVTADDFGYCKERNRGILECFQHGVITRSSLLVTATAAKHAALLAKQHHIPLGLHFNVTEGYPVSRTDQVPSLLVNNVFRGRAGFREAAMQGNIKVDEVKVELEAQLALFKDLAGHYPLYVDGHNHIHVLPGVSEVIADVLSVRGVHSVRLPREIKLNLAQTWLKPTQRMAFYEDVAQEASAAAAVFSKRGVRFSDAFVGMATMGSDMKVTRLEALLSSTFDSLEANSHGKSAVQLITNMENSHTAEQNCDTRILEELISENPSTPYCTAGRTCPNNSLNTGSAPTVGHGSSSPADAFGSLNMTNNNSNTLCDMDQLGIDEEAIVGLPHWAGDSSVGGVGSSRRDPPMASVVELMVHPGYPCRDPDGGCGSGPDDFSRSSDRSHELNVLKSDSWRTMCEKNRLNLCAQLSC